MSLKSLPLLLRQSAWLLETQNSQKGVEAGALLRVRNQARKKEASENELRNQERWFCESLLP